MFFFLEKNYKVKLLTILIWKKIKIDKDNSGKKTKKKEKKTIWGNTVAIKSVLKKKLQS
jgi:hypothetical protein